MGFCSIRFRQNYLNGDYRLEIDMIIHVHTLSKLEYIEKVLRTKRLSGLL